MTITATIIAEPRFEITISKPMMTLLIKLSNVHCDQTCQKASGANGFLLDWRETIGSKTSYSLTSKELDLTTKIIETSPFELSLEEQKMRNEYLLFVHHLCQQRARLHWPSQEVAL